jgi:hypothetical protein
MREIAAWPIVLATLMVLPGAADEKQDPKDDLVRLSDVTVTAQPTGKRHQSYIFTLKCKQSDSSWTFELYQDFGGGILLFIAGNEPRLGDKKVLESHHHKATVLRLAKIDPERSRPGATLTHKLVSMTWGELEPNNAAGSDRR